MIDRSDVLTVGTEHLHMLLDVALMNHRHLLGWRFFERQPTAYADVPGTRVISGLSSAARGLLGLGLGVLALRLLVGAALRRIDKRRHQAVAAIFGA